MRRFLLATVACVFALTLGLGCGKEPPAELEKNPLKSNRIPPPPKGKTGK